MSADVGGRDKRRYERVRVPASKNVWNISEGGAFIATESPKRLGATFMLELRLGGGNPTFRTMARVIRVLHKPNPKTEEPAGMAVKFERTSDDDVAIIRNYITTKKLEEELG